MTVSTRTSAPSYKIFEPDALDQIYAKGALDPLMGGFAGSLALSHGANKAGYQEQYLASQEKFNRMAATLDAMEMSSKQKTELLKGAVDLIGKGESPDRLFGGNEIYRNDQNALLPGLMAQKAAGGGGGSSLKEYDTITHSTINDDGGSSVVAQRRAPGTAKMPTKPGAPGSTPTTSQAATPENKGKVIVAQAEKLYGQGNVVYQKNGDGIVAINKGDPSQKLEFNSDGVLKR